LLALPRRLMRAVQSAFDRASAVRHQALSYEWGANGLPVEVLRHMLLLAADPEVRMQGCD
jgi:hypothetical protein